MNLTIMGLAWLAASIPPGTGKGIRRRIWPETNMGDLKESEVPRVPDLSGIAASRTRRNSRGDRPHAHGGRGRSKPKQPGAGWHVPHIDRKSTRLNSSHLGI